MNIIFLLFFSYIAMANSCLNEFEIQKIIESSMEKLTPLIQTIPKKIQVSYKNKPGNIFAYTYAASDEISDIRIIGKECKNLLHADEIQMILCHEIGHLAGGEPYMNFIGNNIKLSAEGQSDFFAVSSCLPFLWKNNFKNENFRPEAVDYCKNNKNPLCTRIASAALNFQEYHHQLIESEKSQKFPPSSPGKKPELSQEETTKVKKTLLREYPSAQCRLDIMKKGIECEALQLPQNYHSNPSAPLQCSAEAVNVDRPRCFWKKE